MIKDLREEFFAELDTLARKEFEIQFSKGDDISIPIIQRKCKVGWNAASRLLTYLIKEKKITKNNHIYSVL
jgi:hypothetical protein